MKDIYDSRQRAITRAIIPALDDPDDYDLDAIFDATFGWYKHREPSGDINTTKCGHVQTATEDEFWAAVAKAAK